MDGAIGVDYHGKKIHELFPNVNEFGLIEVLENVFITGNSQELALKGYKVNDDITLYRTNRVQKLNNDFLVCTYTDETDNYAQLELIEKETEILKKAFNYAAFKIEGDLLLANSTIDKIIKTEDNTLQIKEIKKYLSNISDKTNRLMSILEKGVNTN
ncbi:hypothetical protein [Flammeovirga kamogawensis]|uniref:Uncharacterized protein n=1 Tax=Flammeovirga kamogawensis TaxID=373891 RepID=A0ABX8H4D2_9BACT|nr:hypothetical protein [Flammeovirga kamogawensis]MBB6461749.1 hypothetical protein [Flammeovirga kamogawensis]QWG10665.1 hypothetical protein KM029_25110 [Flammeovirga kamogawensis]TRX63769.1 hypothetical protein EO216_25490 [Flammeovirga kamogawensis]